MIRRGSGPPGPSMVMACALGLRGMSGNAPRPLRRFSLISAGGAVQYGPRPESLATISAFWARISSLMAEGSKRAGSIMRNSGWVAFVAGPCDEAHAKLKVHYA